MNRSPPRFDSFTLIAVLFESGLALAAVLIGWLFAFSPVEKLRLDAGNWWQMVLLGVAAAVPMFAGLAAIERLPLAPLVRLREVAEKLLVKLIGRCTLAELAIISLCAGLGEEVLFRGLLQGGLAAWLGEPWGVWIALAVASLVFGLAHAITRTYIALAALAGLYLGLLFLWTDNLVPPILAHAIYDFGALWYLMRRGKP